MSTKFTRKKYLLETGFSMLEAVVVVGVLLALAVGGFLSYGPIAENAKMATVVSTAAQMATATTTATFDGDSATQPQDVIDDWNASTGNIRVELLAATNPNASRCVTAYWVDYPAITAQRGFCPPSIEPTPAPQEATIAYSTSVMVGVSDPSFGVQDVHVQIGNQSGQQLVDQTVRTDVNGYAYVLLADSGEFPARFGADGLPIYDVRITLSNLAGYMFAGEVTPSDFTETSEDGTITSYTVTGDYLVNSGGTWVKRFG
jgi:type II secretory pathway pseudopilin PulG